MRRWLRSVVSNISGEMRCPQCNSQRGGSDVAKFSFRCQKQSGRWPCVGTPLAQRTRSRPCQFSFTKDPASTVGDKFEDRFYSQCRAVGLPMPRLWASHCWLWTFPNAATRAVERPRTVARLAQAMRRTSLGAVQSRRCSSLTQSSAIFKELVERVSSSSSIKVA